MKSFKQLSAAVIIALTLTSLNNAGELRGTFGFSPESARSSIVANLAGMDGFRYATRIGWTYYSYSKAGVQPVSSKNGWDEEKGTTWNN